MFLPIGDAPNPKGTPFVTRALTAVNVAVFLESQQKLRVGQLRRLGW